jgi:predicted nucleotidyltransferase
MKLLSSEINTQLQQAGVMTLYLFGSRAQKKENVFSDFDFAILLKNPSTIQHGSLNLYNTLYPILSQLTNPTSLEQDVIDIVFLDSPMISLELKSHVVQTGQLLLDEDPDRRSNFESAVMIANADFLPLKKIMSAGLINRQTD